MPECFITQWQRSGVTHGYVTCAGQDGCVNCNTSTQSCQRLLMCNPPHTYKVPTVYTATYECVWPHSEALLRHAQSNSPKSREGGAVEPQHRFGTLSP